MDANKISCEYFSFNTKNKAGTAPTLENLAQFETEKLKHLRGPRRPLDPIGNIEYDLLPELILPDMTVPFVWLSKMQVSNLDKRHDLTPSGRSVSQPKSGSVHLFCPHYTFVQLV